MRSKNVPNDQTRQSFIETARRKQIIECTIETLAEKGYWQTSLDKIAQKAGISKGVILYYFKNKDTLILETAQYIFGLDMEKAHQQMETELTAAGKLNNYIAYNLEFMQKRPKQLKAVVEIITNLRTAEGNLYFDVRSAEPTLAELEKILKLGQKTGEFRQFDTRVMAISIRGSIDAVAARTAIGESQDVGGQAHELVEIYLRATKTK
jgi:TetR/AcrR family transcriptional regulator, fatty acid metabolism regulator protein